MRCASLISGSKANSFYIENENDALLIDAGLSLPKMEQTIATLHLHKDKLRGILVTHEHDDHIRHLKRVASAYKLPVYMTEKSYNKAGLTIKDHIFIKPNDILEFGSIIVDPFEVLHDAEQCLGFTFEDRGKKIFYASDIGSYNDFIIQKAYGSHFIGIEANYELSMLSACPYPQYLKKRISGGSGHLANHEAARFVRDAAGVQTQYVMFLHISENSNCLTHVGRMIDEDLLHYNSQISYQITNRHSHSPLITI